MTPTEKSLALIKWSKPGVIYAARNRANGHLYVGQTTKGIPRRLYIHKRDSTLGSHCVFHKAIRKYGIAGFDVFLLQRCYDPICLNQAEKWWIRHLNCIMPNGYNMIPGGGAVLITEETRKKMSANMKRRMTPEYLEKLSERARNAIFSPDHKENISRSLKGKKKSQEHIKKMSEGMIGKYAGEKNHFYGKKHSEETKKKMSASRAKLMTSGYKTSDETRRKISENVRARGWFGENHPRFGHHCSEEHKRKISEAQKGRIVSEDTRKKLSVAAKGNKANSGRKFTEEHKKKIGEASRRNESCRYLGKTPKVSGNDSQIALDFGHGGSALSDSEFSV